MRIHRLELTAFGPFPGTEVVDFDRLNDAGLFLLTGPTGAGKTSILDAVCFALYAAVPGDRNGAKAFKSHHAPAEAAPSVVLELTVRDRRMRVRRQPGWRRPSRRARSGFVEERTKASIEEYVDGGWRTHSTRVDEVGHLVSSVLGMNKDQFCQVVMLPQGEFKTFLSAGAKERHDVLESLFRTHRFQAIERWLAEHRKALDLECRTIEVGLDRLLARADEVLTGVDPQEPSGPPTTAEDYPRLLTSLRARSDALLASAAAASDEAVRASEAAKQSQHGLDAARTLVDLQRRHRELQNHVDELASAAPEVRRREREVVLARQAAAFEPLLDLVAETGRAVTDTQVAVAEAGTAAWRPSPEHDLSSTEAVAAQADDLRAEQARLEALTDTQRELDRLDLELAELDAAVDAGSTREVEGVTALAVLPAELDAARSVLAAAQQAGSRLPSLEDEVTVATRVRDAARRSVELAGRATTSAAELLEAREARADARELLHDVRERRIAGMAAQLSAALVAGQPCPVCGSDRHPDVARPSPGDVTAEDEATCQQQVEAAEHAVGSLELRRERVVAERTAADHAADGLTPARAELALDTATTRRTQTAEAAAGVPSALARVESLERRRDELQRSLDQTRESLHTLATQHAERSRVAATLRTRVESAIGAAKTLAQRRTTVGVHLASTEALGAALRVEQDAVEAQRSARRRLDQLVAGSVFATVRQVCDAVRSEADVASAEALNRAHATDKAATERALADPTLVRAAQSPVPDLEVLTLTAEQAAATAGLAATRASRLESAAARLEALVGEVAEGLDRWAPLRHRRDLADRVSATVAGTSQDNHSRTKLSHYVLAARLEQVVNAANMRLHGICAGRYELEHTLLRGVGDARGGLGLRVLDTYTGSRRDPATLSGGETFYVSLALALGLADLVNSEIGGAELSTLFVDEGFGSLDSDTLDEVMDELDALRCGGRSVGLVSHLAELRMRVPAQLSVVRSPHGSRLDDSRREAHISETTR